MERSLSIIIFTILFLSLQNQSSAEETEQGETIYRNYCAPCHADGMAGAPIVGDKEVWSLILWQGTDAVIKHSLEGYKGNRGEMPAKGGTVN